MNYITNVKSCKSFFTIIFIGFVFLIGFFYNSIGSQMWYNAGMDILEVAIKAAGGTGRLAYLLDVRQNVISNWRQRGVPKSWEQVLKYKFKKQIAEAQKMI